MRSTEAHNRGGRFSRSIAAILFIASGAILLLIYNIRQSGHAAPKASTPAIRDDHKITLTPTNDIHRQPEVEPVIVGDGSGKGDPAEVAGQPGYDDPEVVVRTLTGGLLETGAVVGGEKDGLWRVYDADGLLFEEVPYSVGKIDGTRIMYSPEGSRASETTYVMGKVEGIIKAWHPNGVLAFEIETSDGQYHGKCMSWHPTGLVKEDSSYSKGKLSGPCYFYDKAGNMDGSKSGIYEQGKKVAGI